MAEIKRQEADLLDTQDVALNLHGAQNASTSSNGEPPTKRIKKVICICREPRDPLKPEIVCRTCKNIFHKQCITAKATSRFFKCAQCVVEWERTVKHCHCSKPHDDKRFYILCDYCQKWFHGSCEGVTKKQSAFIDKFSCSECRKKQCITTYKLS